MTDVLQIHKNKCGKILFQCRDGISNQYRVGTENPDQHTGSEDDQAPHDGGIAKDHERHDNTGVFDTGRTAGAVIIAQDRRGSLRDRVNRRFHELPHAGNDGHNGNIDIPAGDGKDVVAADRNKTVGQLHDKAGSTEADDVFGKADTLGKFCFSQKTNLQFGFFRQEKQDERGRKQLGENRCNCSALHAETEHKDKERVEEQIGSCADGDGAHTNKGISLCVDKRIHADCDHRRQRTDEIDHHVWICID